MAVAIAAKQIIVDNMAVTIGAGVESISLVQNEHANKFRTRDPVARRAHAHDLCDDAGDR